MASLNDRITAGTVDEITTPAAGQRVAVSEDGDPGDKYIDIGARLEERPVVATGSNADGTWIKTYLTETTGLLECRIKKEVSSHSITSAVGDIFVSSGALGAYTWPAEFSALPYQMAAIKDAGGFQLWTAERDYSTLSVTQTSTFRAMAPTSATRDIVVEIIGKGTFDDTP